MFGSAFVILAVAALAVPFHFEPSTYASAAGLLRGASFETGSSIGPDDWSAGQRLDGVRYVWDDELAHTGRRSISIEKHVDRYFPIADWSQTIEYDGKSPAIEFSGWMKADQMYKSVLDVTFATQDGVATHQWVAYIGAKNVGDPPESFDWKWVGGSVSIPPGTKEITLSLEDYGPGKVWLDDVSARYVVSNPKLESHL